MDEHTTTKPARKKPGPVFFMGAMLVYLLLVHGLSLAFVDWSSAFQAVGQGAGVPPYMTELLYIVHRAIGQSKWLFCLISLALLYACMICIFLLTRRIVKGPVWLGSLAAVVFMAHPAKTEVLFSVVGLYFLCSALFALLAMLACLRLAEAPGAVRFTIALLLFALASFPFPINAALLSVLILLEFFPGTPETRQWPRLIPFFAVTVAANGLHLETLYAQLPDPVANFRPLLLLLYPIGLLPSTEYQLHASHVAGWFWGLATLALIVAAFALVKNGAFRIALLALLSFRFYPGMESINLTTLAGGGQLLVPLALACIALAGFCRWLQRFEAWGSPVVALTTMLCVVLFVLQFQANLAQEPGRTTGVVLLEHVSSKGGGGE